MLHNPHFPFKQYAKYVNYVNTPFFFITLPGVNVLSFVTLSLLISTIKKQRYENSRNCIMIKWIIIFLVVALVAAVFGFTGIAAGAASIAQVLFYIFLVILVISLILGGVRGWK